LKSVARIWWIGMVLKVVDLGELRGKMEGDG
jgi:hypothetical protein